ncbi:MAG: LiaF transmembrane domain-containing protein [Bacteroidales bacterium]
MKTKNKIDHGMKHHNEENHGSPHGMNNLKRFLTAFLLIGAGLVWLGANLNYIDETVKEYVISWQALLIGIGIVGLAGSGSRWFHIALIFTGSLFLFAKHNDLPVDAHLVVWPVLLIFAGLAFLTKIGNFQKIKKRIHESGAKSVDYLDDTNVFGGNKFNVTSKNFRGGQITNVFGGSEIDLTTAELAEGENRVEMTCVFGGVKLIVPADWDVHVAGNGILGGFSDKRQMITDKHVDHSKKLIITGICIFGGGEITSVIR